MTQHDLQEELVLDILGLAHKYGFADLETSVSEYLKVRMMMVCMKQHNLQAIINARNLCTIFGASLLYELKSLTTHCLEYGDKHASDVLASDAFLTLNLVCNIEYKSYNNYYHQ